MFKDTKSLQDLMDQGLAAIVALQWACRQSLAFLGYGMESLHSSNELSLLPLEHLHVSGWLSKKSSSPQRPRIYLPFPVDDLIELLMFDVSADGIVRAAP